MIKVITKKCFTVLGYKKNELEESK